MNKEFNEDVNEYEAEIAQEIVETFHLQDLIKPLYEDTPISIKVRIDLAKVRKLVKRISKLKPPEEIIASGEVMQDIGKIGELSFLTIMSRIDKYLKIYDGQEVTIKIEKG